MTMWKSVMNFFVQIRAEGTDSKDNLHDKRSARDPATNAKHANDGGLDFLFICFSLTLPSSLKNLLLAFQVLCYSSTFSTTPDIVGSPYFRALAR